MKCLRSAFLGLGLLLAVSAAHAQESGVKANIPFDFVAGNQVLPAGEYLVTPEGSSGQVVLIRSSDNKAAKFATAFNCSSVPALGFNETGFPYHGWPLLLVSNLAAGLSTKDASFRSLRWNCNWPRTATRPASSSWQLNDALSP